MVGTPGSIVDSGGPSKPSTVKDRNCPFCQVPFTSSSLGRHLDLYIREKNPKPPDNVHNVNEIRKLRGSVTRRQPRTSSSKREGSTPSYTMPTPLRVQRSPETYVGPNYGTEEEVKLSQTKANWETTRAINDLPRVTREEPPTHIKPRNVSRKSSLKDDFFRKQSAMDERDRGRAAELALKEVLGSVKAAKYVLFA